MFKTVDPVSRTGMTSFVVRITLAKTNVRIVVCAVRSNRRGITIKFDINR
ncbi:hypothetical protein HCR16_01485 [Wolbachia pipientis]|nr:hypothetical protein [Wolbachia pipientis]MBA8769840.1 hypothetical protein [Wolbachia pipientis]